MRKTVFTMLLMFGIGIAGNAVADPRADALFAQAKKYQDDAHAKKVVAAAKRQEAQNDEIFAMGDEREAQILIAQALGILKADGNKQRAWNDRNTARALFWQAQADWVESRNLSARAAAHRHDMGELQRAQGTVRDQPGVVAQLNGDIKRQSDAAALDDQAAARAKADGDAAAAKARALWDDANRVDPPTPAFAKIVQQPTIITIREPPTLKASVVIVIK